MCALKNFIEICICNEIFPCLEGCSGLHCLSNNPRQFCQNILPSDSHVCRTFYLSPPHCVLSLPMQTTVRSVHFVAAITTITFSTLPVTFSPFHIISIAYRPVISAVIIPHIIGQCHRTILSASSALLQYKRSTTAARIKHHTCNTDRRAVSLTYKLPNTATRIRSGTRSLFHRLLSSNVSSYSEVHERTFFVFKETKKIRMYLRDTQRQTEI